MRDIAALPYGGGGGGPTAPANWENVATSITLSSLSSKKITRTLTKSCREIATTSPSFAVSDGVPSMTITTNTNKTYTAKLADVAAPMVLTAKNDYGSIHIEVITSDDQLSKTYLFNDFEADALITSIEFNYTGCTIRANPTDKITIKGR